MAAVPSVRGLVAKALEQTTFELEAPERVADVLALLIEGETALILSSSGDDLTIGADAIQEPVDVGPPLEAAGRLPPPTKAARRLKGGKKKKR